MKDHQDNTAKNWRDENGKFTEGHPGMGGRPKGSFSLVSILKEKLSEVPFGEKRTRAEQLVEKIIESAIQDGNDQQIKNILHYTEGLPHQTIDQNVNLAEKMAAIFRSYNE